MNAAALPTPSPGRGPASPAVLRRSAARSRSTPPPSVGSVLASPGRPLDGGTRAFMEPRFGHSFADVRVHDDSRAAASATAVGAHAYAAGPHVVFGPGRFSPSTHGGRRLIAHELAHVVQQSGGGGSADVRRSLAVGRADAPEEREAEAAADRVVSGPAPLADGALSGGAPAVRRLAGPVVDPTLVQEFRTLFTTYQSLVESGAIAAEETAAVTAAVAEAETAIVAAAEVAAAGTTLAAGAEGATATAIGLAADDVTGIGVADDVAIPFVVVAAIGLGIAAYVVASSADQIAAAVRAAVQAVQRAIRLLREAVARGRTRPPAPAPVPADPPAPAPGPGPAPAPAPRPPAPAPRPPAPAPRPPGPAPAPRPRPRPRPQPEEEPRPRPGPGPDVDVDTDDDENERRCRTQVIGQAGGNSCHDAFARQVSGVGREVRITTPRGLSADFDALGAGRTVFEIKTGYRHLLGRNVGTEPLRQATIARFQAQSANQVAVAEACGYNLVWVFNIAAVADVVDGLIEPTVTSRPFLCEEDR